MKKCNFKRRLYFKRLADKHARRKFRKREKGKKGNTIAITWDCILHAPEVFTLYSKPHRKKLLQFISQLNHACRSVHKRIKLDLSKTKQMVSDGTLLFRAHLCRIVNDNPTLTIKIRFSRSSKINQVLQQIGVCELLNQNIGIVPDHPDVVNWRYAQGAGALGEKYEDILGPYDGALAEALSERLYNGLTEAMTNTRQHAYPNNTPDENFDTRKNEWWMFSQEKDDRLSVVFCDLGVGIPASLPKKKPRLWRKIKNKFGETPKDSKVISEAIKFSKTRTEQKHRGKGLRQLTNVLENTEGGTLLLYSNHGSYDMSLGQTLLKDYKRSIGGTLITWSIPINQ